MMKSDNARDRRQILLSALGLAALSSAGAASGRPRAAQPAAKQIQAPALAFAFITKRPELTSAELRARYETGHVPAAVSAMVPMGLQHYVRNYVVRATGLMPDFDVISEFGFRPGSIAPNVCGSNIDPDWSRNSSAAMTEELIAGSVLPAGTAPVSKRAIVLRRPAAVAADVFTSASRLFAQTTARQLGKTVHRVSLYTRVGPMQAVHECIEIDPGCEAVLMLWPASGTTLPDVYRAPPQIAMTSVLDLDAVASVIAATI